MKFGACVQVQMAPSKSEKLARRKCNEEGFGRLSHQLEMMKATAISVRV
jgi:hypothetical protein